MSTLIRAPINPQVLRWSREAAGYEIADVARSLGTKPERVEAWETGAQQPTMGQLRRLATLLQRTPAFFFRAYSPREDLARPPDFRTTVDSGFASSSLRKELRSVVDRRDAYIELARPTPGRFEPLIDVSDPEAAASQARDLFGITIEQQTRVRDYYQSLTLWISAIEAQGVLVFQTGAFPIGEARGASIYFDVLPIVLVNAKDPIVARSFTLLHEFFHLCRGTGSLCDVYGRVDGIERACNRFAACTLMPAEAFSRGIEDRNAADAVPSLARRFKVSEDAAAIRLHELGFLSRLELVRVQGQTADRVASASTRDASPVVEYYRKRLRDLGRTYVGTVLDAYYKDELTLTDVSQYLGVKLQHVRSMEAALRRASDP